MSKPQPVKTYTRFSLFQRVEHFLFLLSFSLLGITGLPQKYLTSPLSLFVINVFGGIELTRIIHRSSATVMMALAIYHVLVLIYKIYVLRTAWSMMPVIDDFKHLIHDLQYYFGMRKHKAYYGRYNYAEKMEYLAVVWGTVVMALTGFMMWNPIATARFLPGEAIPAAKAAHGGEAVLAVLAIILWHFYHVHIKSFNKSMFIGVLTREEMEHEHPAELAQIEAGSHKQIPLKVLRQRQQVYLPIAAVITLISGWGLFQFVTFEETAIITVPLREQVEAFVPLTPTPRPTLTPTPTLAPGEVAVAEESWAGKYEALFKTRCSTCHGITSVGGLSLATLEQAKKGGNNGPGILPGDPDNSMVIKIQIEGGHPGQLTPEEIEQVKAWILAGAPEK